MEDILRAFIKDHECSHQRWDREAQAFAPYDKHHDTATVKAARFWLSQDKEQFLRVTVAHSDYLIPIANLERMPMCQWTAGRDLLEVIETEIDNAVHSIHQNAGLDLTVVELTWDEYQDHKDKGGY